MLNSMTGFAREVAETAFGTLTCELRTVNHRYLDVQFRLPDELRAKEIELRGRVALLLKRGKVECTIHLRRDEGATRELTLNEALVDQLAERLDDVAARLPDSRPVNPVDILRWPGVVGEQDIDAEPLYEQVLVLVDAALASLSAMRASEGQRIEDLIEARLREIVTIAADVRKRIPEVLEAARERQLERIAKLDIEADPGRLETELALIAQKLDVAEELDRLDSHVSEVRAALKADEPVGRRLDFLMQELNREANTLGSKSGDADTTRAAVDLKVLIEQMREQIQNVE